MQCGNFANSGEGADCVRGAVCTEAEIRCMHCSRYGGEQTLQPPLIFFLANEFAPTAHIGPFALRSSVQISAPGYGWRRLRAEEDSSICLVLQDALGSLLRAGEPGDSILMYYSGHGTQGTPSL